VRNRGIGRGSIFFGGLLLAAAAGVLGTSVLMSPHHTVGGDEQVRTTVALFVRNSAIGALLLSALAGYMLFPNPRPRKPVRDRVLIGVIALLSLAALYQLIWVQFTILN